MTETTPAADPWVLRQTIQERPGALGPGAAMVTHVWSRPIVGGPSLTPPDDTDLWCHVAGDGRAGSPFVLTLHVGRADHRDNPPVRFPTIPEIRECLGRFSLKGALFIPGGPVLLAEDPGVEMSPEPITFIQGGAIGPSPAQTRLSLTGGLGLVKGGGA